MRRHGLVVGKKTHTAQKKKAVKDEMDDFVQCIKWKRLMLGVINDDAIVNADKTNACFSPEFQQTVATRGSKTMSVAEPNSSACCTVMVGAAKSGRRMAPHVVFTGKAARHGKITKECLNPADHDHAMDVTHMA